MSITSYVPLGEVMVREGLANAFDTRLADAVRTNSGDPIAMADGLGTLRALKWEDLFNQGFEIEGWMKPALAQLARKH